MNLQQYRYVVTIAEVGSFSQAAKELFVTQSSLSISVKEIEKELNVRLFERSKAGAKLTEAGSDFVVYARRILAQVHELEQHYQESGKKSFTVTAQHYDFLYQPFLKMMEDYDDQYQQFHLIETTTQRILESVRNFESEVGILYLSPASRKIFQRYFAQENLSWEVLGHFPTQIFLGKHHPLTKKETITIEELQSYPQVRFSQENHGLAHLDEDPLTIPSQQTVLHTNDRGTLLNLLSASNAYASGLGIVTSFAKEQIELRPLAHSAQHELIAIFNKSRAKSQIQLAFVNEIKCFLADYETSNRDCSLGSTIVYP
ncbi:MAG: LysR family transcriptional regulator [Enterococcus sp.]|uniref:LysR family transcriptional regulator n=1 Tax=Enterococcus sp. TaxID=35783 RepID=UPI002FC97982